MAEDDPDSKTEEPTHKKLERARDEEGQIPVSQEAKTWAMLIGVLVTVAFMMPWFMPKVGALLRVFIEQPHAIPFDFWQLRAVIINILVRLGLILIVPVGFLVILAVAVSLWQTGGLLITPRKLVPSLSALSPIQGVKRIFSVRQLLEFVKNLFKLAIVGTVVVAVIYPHLPELKGLVTVGLVNMLDWVQDILVIIIIAVVILMAAIAYLDMKFQVFDHRKKLRMTKQEVKDERRQSEGDPRVKQRIARLRVQRARERIMQAVPKADVVVTNPTHYAVALQYDMSSMSAPVLVAKGVDHLAQRIREVAIEHEVTIVENPPLARALYAAVEIDQEIPTEHYKAVAEIIGYVMRLKGKI